jgi:hypothetical protein
MISATDQAIQKTIEVLNTPHKFRQWLNSVPTDTIVGENWSCDSCPIVNFLVAATGYEQTEITEVFVCLGAQQFLLPKWAIQFIEKIDSLPSNGHLTAEYCLQVLEKIN